MRLHSLAIATLLQQRQSVLLASVLVEFSFETPEMFEIPLNVDYYRFEGGTEVTSIGKSRFQN